MGKEQDLLHAVKTEDVATLSRILNKIKNSKSKLLGSNRKVNVNVQDSDGMAGLHQAALMGNSDIMRMLLDGGAQVDIKDSKGMRPLHYAAWQGRPEPVSVLLQWGASVNEVANEGETPLHLACQHGHHQVANQLLYYHTDPTVQNKAYKTPLDLACEFGRYRVVELLLQSNLCVNLLEEKPQDTADNNRTTCLHLAARNGHTDIIRLLLKAGVDINRQTLNGTCLHEAALYGKLEVVKLLLECGIDVSKPNSYDQTALDIVNKFTMSRAAKEMKELLKEACNAVQATAISDYYNVYDPTSISFREGDLITVLEQNPDGRWKGIVFGENHTSQTGYFPSTAVVLVDRTVGGMHRSSSNTSGSTSKTATIKRVAPPQVPDLLNRSGLTLDQNSYGSIGPDNTFPSPPSSIPHPRSPTHDICDHSCVPSCSSSPQHIYPPSSSKQPNYAHILVSGHHPSSSSPDCPENRHSKRFPYLFDRQSCYDDMEHSANPSSPVSSQRSSITSVDSGRSYTSGSHDFKLSFARASSQTQVSMPAYVQVQIQQNRLSIQSCESNASLRQSYHSSSSSLGSLDRLEESGYSSQVNVAELFQAGLQDSEVLRTWLTDLHFEEYFNHFVQAGYDMPTISRATPEDLTAIGITKPAHRKKLKAEIAKLNISDGLPDYKPMNVEEWLRLLNLEQYVDTLIHQGYDNIDYVTELTWEDLEDIGIKKLGHQKKLMIAVKRLKEIEISGARRFSVEHCLSSDMPPCIPEVMTVQPYPFHSQEIPITTAKQKNSPSSENVNIPEFKTFQQSPPKDDFIIKRELAMRSQNIYQPDLVTIQVRSPSRSISRSSTSDTVGSDDNQTSSSQASHGPFDTLSCDGSQVYHQNSLDLDGDITPTNDSIGLVENDTSTLSRPKVTVKPRPVAKIIAKTKRLSREFPNDIIGDSQDCNIENRVSSDWPTPEKTYPCTDFPEKTLTHGSPIILPQFKPASAQGSPSRHSPVSSGSILYSTASLPRTKKPPPPPKRTNSIKSEINIPSAEQAEQVFASCQSAFSQQFSSDQNKSFVKQWHSFSEDFPPPPPPFWGELETESPIKKSEMTNSVEISEMQNCLSESPSNSDELQSNPLFKQKRTESASSFDSNGSTSSNDSNSTIPFANENVGTIKQRLKSGCQVVDIDCEEPLGNPEEKNISHISVKQLVRKVEGDTNTATPSKVAVRPKPALPAGGRLVSAFQKRPDSTGSDRTSSSSELSNGGLDEPQKLRRCTETGDVLNDIGNMLADLTDELDAMLECELKE